MNWFDPQLVIAGLVIGGMVGLTGMGGGALMTPVLVFFFNVDPLTAVSSDVVASFFMKPIGGIVHLRRGTVIKPLVLWLCVGSVPAAFAGVLLLRLIGDGADLQGTVKKALGLALLLAATAMALKSWMSLRDRLAGKVVLKSAGLPQVEVRKVITVIIGLVAGLIVGMTSVGAGSIVIVAMLLVYPTLQAGQLVGTDLVQAVPMVGAASLGHLLFGDFQAGLTAAILVGAIPGVWVGSLYSSKAPNSVIRPILLIVLMGSGVKLLGASDGVLMLVLFGGGAVVATATVLMRRRIRAVQAAERASRESARVPS